MIVGPCARDKGKPVKRRGRKANEAKALSVRHAGRVAVDWRLDLRKSILALAAVIAAAACTDATAPKATPPVNALYRKSDAKKTWPKASLIAPASLWSGYSSQSPHWSHITTMMTDFYYSWTSTERTWAGGHYDHAMSGSGAAWRATNATVQHIPYALLWTTIVAPSVPNITTGYYVDMKRWYAAHTQYSREKAFLHQVGMPRDSAHRVLVNIWGSKRWAINPIDPGAVAYTVNRIQRVTAGESGVFFDETATGNWNNYLRTSQEITTMTAFSGDIATLLKTIRPAIGGKPIMLNTSAYQTAADRVNALAAGAVHLELSNDFKYSGMLDRWKWIESLNGSGVFVDFVSARSSSEVTAMSTTYPKGNSATSVQRAKLWELASYYLAIGATPKLFALQLENTWSTPYSTLWIRAQEANIGHPRATRVLARTGTDPMGYPYAIYTRDFDRALIVLRLQQGWGAQSYGDGTAITFTLPAGERWIPLNADGTVGTAVTSIRLRQSEAAILLKASKM
jgi:hypothetical protein